VFNRTFNVPHYFCRPHLNNVLEEEIEKTFKYATLALLNSLELSIILESI
jgi:hypothetical protein